MRVFVEIYTYTQIIHKNIHLKSVSYPRCWVGRKAWIIKVKRLFRVKISTNPPPLLLLILQLLYI
jgi:hypothetical protein